jgi:PhnB protein
MKAMHPIVHPYLFFGGQCQAALDYYTQHLGAKVSMVMRWADNPDVPSGDGGCGGQPMPPNWQEKIMHAAFTLGESLIMASDGMKEERPPEGHCFSLTMNDEADARKAFAALSDGGQVVMPLGKTFWSPCFGMVTDRFGICWMVTTPESREE